MNINKWFEDEINELVETLARASTKREIEELIGSIVTPREINDMGRRLKVLKMLDEGKSYGEIQTTLGVSPNLISKISCKIGYGFRRTSSAAIKKNPKTKTYKSEGKRYKGATSIHRFLT